MTAMWFLLGALLISGIGSAIIVLRHRNPTDEDWSVEEFRREMHALSPDAARLRRMPPPSHRPAARPASAARPAHAPRHAPSIDHRVEHRAEHPGDDRAEDRGR